MCVHNQSLTIFDTGFRNPHEYFSFVSENVSKIGQEMIWFIIIKFLNKCGST